MAQAIVMNASYFGFAIYKRSGAPLAGQDILAVARNVVMTDNLTTLLQRP